MIPTGYDLNDTYAAGVGLWRVIDENGWVHEYAAPDDTTGVYVGKAILFDMDWTRDSNYTIELKCGDTWVVMCQQ